MCAYTEKRYNTIAFHVVLFFFREAKRSIFFDYIYIFCKMKYIIKRQHVLWNHLRSINVNIFDLLSDDMAADADVLVYVFVRLFICLYLCISVVVCAQCLAHFAYNIEFSWRTHGYCVVLTNTVRNE